MAIQIETDPPNRLASIASPYLFLKEHSGFSAIKYLESKIKKEFQVVTSTLRRSHPSAKSMFNILHVQEIFSRFI